MVLNMGLGDQRNSWLSNQIKAEMEKRKSKLEKEFCVNAIFRYKMCLLLNQTCSIILHHVYSIKCIKVFAYM